MTADSQSNLGLSGSGSSAAADDVRDPESIGKYRIERRIGKGGMGTVYLALDRDLNRRVALKVLPRERSEHPTMVRRFRAEAQAAAALKHDNIVAVYESGQVDGYTFIAMEYVEGIDVHDLVQRREVIPVNRSVDIVKQVARALEHAHERGIIHRDIKPSNLLIKRDGTVKVADLGLARSLDEESSAGITRDGTTVGTIDYMPPEQARSSRKADARSDIYSLGCTWYHMLTGEPPYPEGGLTHRLRLHAEGDLPNPRDINPRVPEGLVAILNRMMAKNPQERYASPTELLEELDRSQWRRSQVTGQILSELESTPAESKATKRPAPLPQAKAMPSRDPRPEQETDSGTGFAFPVRLAGMAAIGIVALTLLVYGAIQFFNRPESRELEGLGYKVDPSDVNPFESRSPESTKTKANRDDSKQPADGKDAGKSDANDAAAKKIPDGNKSGAAPRTTQSPVTPQAGVKVYSRFLPDWAAERESAAVTASEVSVGAPGTGPENFSSLQQAVKALSHAGGTVTIHGAGPFEFPATSFDQQGPVVLQGADANKRPLIIVREKSGLQNFYERNGGALELRGLDFVVIPLTDRSAEPLPIFQILQGNLTVIDCSLSVFGDSARPLVGFQVDQTAARTQQNPDDPSQILLDRTVVIGRNIQALSLNTANADAVFRESLCSSGQAPVVRLEVPAVGVNAVDLTLRLVGSTFVAEQTAIDVAPGVSEQTSHPISIVAAGSLLATNSGSGSSSLLTLRESQIADEQIEGVKWQSVETAYHGWRALVTNLNANQTLIVAPDYDSWKTLWRQPGLKSQFHAAPWPASASPAALHSSLGPYERGTAPQSQATASVGRRPGSALAPLSLGDHDSVDRKLNVPKSPTAPKWANDSFRRARKLSVDLNKVDLGQYLKSTKLPQKVVIEATGSGLRRMTPVTIDDTVVRIEFKQSKGTPLRIEPNVAKGKRGRGDSGAMFTVNSGRLELWYGNFEVPNTDGRQVPNWFVDVRQGDLLIQQCLIRSLLRRKQQPHGLILCRTDSAEPQKRALSSGSVAVMIRDSFLASDGTVVDAQLGRHKFYVDNSVLASRQDLIRCDLSRRGAKSTSNLVLSQCTLSAGDSFFDVGSTMPDAPGNSKLRVFADRCVFGVPMRGAAEPGGPTLMEADLRLLESARLQWIGETNGFSEQISRYLVGSEGSDGSRKSFNSGWWDVWGRDREVTPLTSQGGVLFAEPLQQLRTLKPENFALHPNAEGQTWDSGTAIGADVSEISFNRKRKNSSRGKSTRKRGKGF